MNAAINDAHNLGWKLSHVLKGWAKPFLINTVGVPPYSPNYYNLQFTQYEAERRKYAQDLIAFDQNYASLFSGKARTRPEEEGVTHEEFFA